MKISMTELHLFLTSGRTYSKYKHTFDSTEHAPLMMRFKGAVFALSVPLRRKCVSFGPDFQEGVQGHFLKRSLHPIPTH